MAGLTPLSLSLAVATSLSTALPAPSPTPTPLRACATAPSTAPGKEQVADLEALFAELDANYPFFDEKGIREQWEAAKPDLLARAKRCRKDEDFLELVLETVRCLRDGHAGVRELSIDWPRREPDHWPGVAFLPATENRVVVMAPPRGMEKVLPPGTIVTEIDGRDAREVLEELAAAAWEEGGYFSSPQRARFFAYRQAFSGKRGTKHTIQCEVDGKSKKKKLSATSEVDGWAHNYHMPEGLESSARSIWHGELDGGFGYLYLRRMDETAEEGVAKAIEAHPDVRGWVVDLRGNTGGGYDRTFKETIRGLGTRVAVIADAGCVSAGETFIRDLVNQCSARTFGATTAGSSSSKKQFALPSGFCQVRYSARSRGGVGGAPIEYHGIPPDVPLEAVPEDLQAGKNTEILRALAYLSGESGGGSRD